MNCTSFEYDAVELKCALKAGTGNVADDTLLMATSDSIALFQQLCIPDEHLCPSPYAFERLPEHVLMGIAREVIKAETLEECLSTCLAAKGKIEIDCRSAMYYYDTGECILNGENRATSTAWITNDTLSMRVDYFENNCLDVKCPIDSSVHWIKVGKFTISDKHDVLIEQVTKEQCISYCIENKIDAQPFPCKSYAYSESRMTCHLTSESGLTRLATSDQRTSDERETFEYYEKICLKGVTKCRDISFEHVSNYALMNIADKIVASSSMAICLELCLHSGRKCGAAMFFRDKEECVLSENTQYSTLNQLQYVPEVDYFDNVCDYMISTKMFSGGRMSAMQPTTQKQLNGVNNARLYEARPLFLTNSPDPRVIVEHDALFMDNLELGRVETECGAEGIAITVFFAKPTAGAIFIKDHFATCRSEFTDMMNATVEIALSTLRQDNPPCPGYETNPSMWSFVVVVQKNGLGVPALMTDADRVFNISCDYSNAHVASTSDQDTVLVQEASSQNWSSVSASNDHVQLAVLRDGQPVSTAVMGEELEMRWTLVQDHMEDVGLFLNRCIAERLDGTAPQPPPLTLIADGCINSKVNRLLMRYPITQFGGGLSTKIKATCGKEVNSTMPNSDKKKRQTLDYSIQSASDERVKRQFTAGTFTIVEKREEMEANKNVEQSLNQNMTPFQLPEGNRVCLHQLAFSALATFTAILSVMTIYMLYQYTRIRSQQSTSSGSEGSYSTISARQRVYFGREECFCTPEARMTLSRISRLENASIIGGGRVLVA